MTQKQIILEALKRGDRIKCTDAYPVYHISPHSFTRIAKKLRDEGVPVLDIEIPPKNGGTPYKEYYIKRTEPIFVRLKQVSVSCEVCGSYYQRDGVCNRVNDKNYHKEGRE